MARDARIPQPEGSLPRRLAPAAIAALLLVLAVVGYLLWQLRTIASNVRPSDAVAAAVATQLSAPPGRPAGRERAEPTYVLVMGGPGGGERSLNTLLLARLEPAEGGRAAVLWIPPKALVVGAGTTGSVSDAFAKTGAAGAIRRVKQLTGLPIHHYVRFEVSGLAEAVDIMGGVWVDPSLLPEESSSATAPPVARKGDLKLDGADVLAYAQRSSGNDAASKRGLLVVNAALSQARERLMSPSAIRLLLAASRSTETDMGTAGLLRLAESMRNSVGHEVRQHYLTGPTRGGWMRLDPGAAKVRSSVRAFAEDRPAG